MISSKQVVVPTFSQEDKKKADEIINLLMEAGLAANLSTLDPQLFLGENKEFCLRHFGDGYIALLYGAAIGKLFLKNEKAALNFLLNAQMYSINDLAFGIAFVGGFDYLDELAETSEIASAYIIAGAAQGNHWEQVNKLLSNKYVDWQMLAVAALQSNSFSSRKEAIIAFSQIENGQLRDKLAQQMQRSSSTQHFLLPSAAYRAGKLRLAQSNFGFNLQQAYAWSSPTFRMQFYLVLQNQSLHLDLLLELATYLADAPLSYKDIYNIYEKVAKLPRRDFVLLTPLSYPNSLFSPFATQLFDHGKKIIQNLTSLNTYQP